MENQLVFRNQTILMQRLADLMRHGYGHYTSGTIACEKVIVLCTKFDKLYFLSDNKARRNYRKSKGLGNAFLLLADLHKNRTLTWWLLVTAGEHPAHKLEQLLHAQHRAQRIRIAGYELVQLPKEKRHVPLHKRNDGEVRWTWRMTDELYLAWRDKIKSAFRAKNVSVHVHELVTALYQTPGFGRARAQVAKLVVMLQESWLRAGQNPTNLRLPATLPVVRRLADDNYTVCDWLRENNVAQHRAETAHERIDAPSTKVGMKKSTKAQ